MGFCGDALATRKRKCHLGARWILVTDRWICYKEGRGGGVPTGQSPGSLAVSQSHNFFGGGHRNQPTDDSLSRPLADSVTEMRPGLRDAGGDADMFEKRGGGYNYC